MFRRLEGLGTAQRVTLHFEDRALSARAGDSVAVALLEGGCVPLRSTPVTGAPRAPMCLMGVCFDCLVEIDGRPNVQACMVEVREGMRVRRQQGARRPA
ncbi:MAG: (2Fe-2S)-binding protein [Burkholderiaceae bacterium]|jgi:predicted molibdopterin-dependent oxidoreductase YjgC|nr:(2Fe-2S)-binding protein [Burkholderiaceae bacterium]